MKRLALFLIGLSCAGAFVPGALPTLSARSHTLSHVSWRYMTVPLGLRMEVNSFPKKVPKPKSRLTVGDDSCAKVTVQQLTTYFLSRRVTDETSYQAGNSGMADSSADCLDSAINALMLNQVYGVTTFDSTFKYVMRDTDVCLEFVNTFARLEQAQGVTLLDDSMNPIKELTAAREFLDSKEN